MIIHQLRITAAVLVGAAALHSFLLAAQAKQDSPDQQTIRDLMQSQAGQSVADLRARAGRAGFGL